MDDLQSARILVIDDQPANVQLLEGLLARGGYRCVRSLTDPREALSQFEQFHPDLILLDLLMPYVDGFALLSELREGLAGDPYVPVVVLTADTTPETRQRALTLGATDFLNKPFDAVEVLLRIRNLLEGRKWRLRLEQQNYLLEARVQARTQALAASLQENRRLLAEAQRNVERLAALRMIDLAVSSTLDLNDMLDVLLEQVVRHLQVDGAALLLADSGSQMLEYIAARGFSVSALCNAHLHLGEGYAGRAAAARQRVCVPDMEARADAACRGEILAQSAFERATGAPLLAYFALPLVTQERVTGVLELFHGRPLPPDGEWLDFLEAMAGRGAIAIDNAMLFNALQRSNQALVGAYDATIEGWSRALDLRDKETEGHSLRVTEVSVRLAERMGMNEEELVQVRRGALLHDIGKMGVPDSILLKPGQLSSEEWEIMRRHPIYGFEMLAPIEFLHPALAIPYCHHEKWDGTGYPRGLAGEEIPLAARIFAVVDVWDALLSDRPYRLGWAPERVLAYLEAQAGTHFDPAVVESFLGLLAESDSCPLLRDRMPEPTG